MTIPTNLTIDFTAGGLVYRGHTLADLRRSGLDDAVILPALVDALCVEVDAEAERQRAPWLTSGFGQSLEYRRVEHEALAALDAPGSASAQAYPMLAATVGIDIDPETGEPATDVLGVARGVTAAGKAWVVVGAEIRRVRLAGKAAITAAATVEEATAAYAALVWPKIPG